MQECDSHFLYYQMSLFTLFHKTDHQITLIF